MSARLASGIEVSALLRRVAALGGNGTVLARGDGEAGAILLVMSERGRTMALLERRLVTGDRYGWATTGPADSESPGAINGYVARRRAIDGDLWVVELDIVGVERFAEELIAAD